MPDWAERRSMKTIEGQAGNAHNAPANNGSKGQKCPEKSQDHQMLHGNLEAILHRKPLSYNAKHQWVAKLEFTSRGC